MKLKATLTTLLTAVLLSESAAALSCVRPDLARTMEQAKSSNSVYYVLVGTFRSAPPMPHPRDHYQNQNQFEPKPPTITQSRFTGFSLGRHRGVDVPLSSFPVDIETSCMASWCGSVPQDGAQIIAFVEERPGRTPILRMSPCNDKTFQVSRGDGQVAKLRTCLDNQCVSDDPHYGR